MAPREGRHLRGSLAQGLAASLLVLLAVCGPSQEARVGFGEKGALFGESRCLCCLSPPHAAHALVRHRDAAPAAGQARRPQRQRRLRTRHRGAAGAAGVVAGGRRGADAPRDLEPRPVHRVHAGAAGAGAGQGGPGRRQGCPLPVAAPLPEVRQECRPAHGSAIQGGTFRTHAEEVPVAGTAWTSTSVPAG